MASNSLDKKKLADKILAEDHADYVVKRLEQFIRDGRSKNEGMSFKKWQMMAKFEIMNSILETKVSQIRSEKLFYIFLFIGSAAMITIGFWGAAVNYDKVDLFTAGAICAASGFVILMLLGFIHYNQRRSEKEVFQRAESLKNITNLSKRIKKLERELETEEKELNKKLEKIRKPNERSLLDALIL